MSKSTFDVESENIFGPGTDLIVSLVAVLVMITAVYKAMEELRIGQVRDNQIQMVNSIANNSIINGVNLDLYSDFHKVNDNISVRHQGFTQTFTFGQDILFPSGKVYLNKDSKKILSQFGLEVQRNIDLIGEIQISGHADIIPPADYRSNVVLAFERSNVVFEFLKNESLVNPSITRMSVTSYGEFLPVNRRNDEGYDWTEEKISNENNSPEKRGLNRRIEIVLTYKK